MKRKLCKILSFIGFIALMAVSIAAQSNDGKFPSDEKQKDDVPKSIKEMLTKKRIEQDKKEHQELLKKGEEAMAISDQLEQSFAQHNQLSAFDKERLDYLTVLVKKIRKGIGASDDDIVEDIESMDAVDKEEKPSTLEAAFKTLQSTAVKLVDELKKTTRFSISAIAIQSSNTLLKIVRFIRIGK